jgi:hypothetical protein
MARIDLGTILAMLHEEAGNNLCLYGFMKQIGEFMGRRRMNFFGNWGAGV